MAGGRWLSQNKVRPGAYLNFKSIPRPEITLGARGIGTIMLPLSWGSQDGLIDVYSDEMTDRSSLAKVGFTAFDAESKLLGSMLSYCYLAKVRRMDAGGAAAMGSLGNIGLKAKYNGEFGNRLSVIVEEQETDIFMVRTFVDGAEVDKQLISDASELVSNDFIVFSVLGSGVIGAGTANLAGGENGDILLNAWDDYMNVLGSSMWQTLAVTVSDVVIKKRIADFIKDQNEDQGRYVQAVFANYNTPDHESCISILNGFFVDEVGFSNADATATFAGMTAGAAVNESNTARAVNGATAIIGELSNREIVAALNAGHIVFTMNQSGTIKVEQDINTYRTFTEEKASEFRKNRIIRVMHTLGTDTISVWEEQFMGRVDNTPSGRGLFRANRVGYLNVLQRISAIQNFDGAVDIEVFGGDEPDAVRCEVWIQPVDSMEKLYMNVNLRT